MKTWRAWAFESDLEFSELVAVLDRDGPWTWTDRDNESWGDYRRTSIGDTGVRVYEGEVGRFGLDAKFWGDDATESEFDDVVETIQTVILPLIKARNVRKGDIG